MDHIVLASEHTNASALGVEKKKMPPGTRCRRIDTRNELMS